MAHITVIKLGGSLFDMSDLGQRLELLLDHLAGECVVIVPGGGTMAEVVRDWDQTHKLDGEQSHQLAVWTMSVTARFVATLSDRLRLASCFNDLSNIWNDGRVAVLDVAHEVLTTSCTLPHNWDVTSDSIGAWVAGRIGARRIVLTKSVDPTEDAVDRHFATVLHSLPLLEVDWLNLRRTSWTAIPLGSKLFDRVTEKVERFAIRCPD